MESDCVPTRGALMTGRQAIRTGAFQSTPAGLPQGLTRWEKMLSELLSEAGYSTGLFGKWHLGDSEERLPIERGFDEWYGLPRTMNEALFTTGTNYDPEVLENPYIMAGKRGAKAQNVKVLDLESRRLVDREIVEHTIDFMKRKKEEGNPFFAYVPITQMHFPNLAHPDFVGYTGHGEMADSLAEMDYNVGNLIDAIDELELTDNTILIFGSDNGPEFRRPWRGTAGYWRSTYHTAMEGSLRAPFMIRWPGHIPQGIVTDEIIHMTDMFSTLLTIVGIDIPSDRAIDGIDQTNFFLGQQEKSNREGFVFYIKDQLRAVKWRNWKMHLVWEPEVNDGPIKLESPLIFNLIQDPKEETNVATVQAGWVNSVAMRMIHDFQQSLRDYPPIPPGTTDPYKPPDRN